MVQENFLTQMGGVDVSVDLGGGNGLVTKHGLDGTEVGTAFEQGGGKGMAEGVGRDGLLDAGFCHKVFNHEEDHDTSEGLLAPMAHKDIVLIFGRNGQEIAVKKIEMQFVDGFLGNRH